MTSLLSDRVNRQTDRQTDRLMTDTGENIISSSERETHCKKSAAEFVVYARYGYCCDSN